MSNVRITSDESTGTNLSEIIQGVDYGEPSSQFVTVEFHPLPSEDIVGNYYAAVRATVGKLRRYFEEADMAEQLYDLDPVLVVEGVDNNVMESLPNPVGQYYVKCTVESGSLFILDLSTGPYHSTAAGNVVQQGGNYSTNLTGCRILSQPDSTAVYPGCPDLALVAAPRYTPAESHVSPRIVIVEVEVSNRTVRGMRRDYWRYFNEPSMFCVVGIKFFKDAANKATRAAAVMWNRAAAGAPIVVTAVRDFGLLPLSAHGRRFFAEQRNLQNLPAIPTAEWRRPENRFSPLPDAGVHPVHPQLGASIAASNWIRTHDPADAFQGMTRAPLLRIPGADIQARLVNVPPGTLLPDFVLDLAMPLWLAAQELQ